MNNTSSQSHHRGADPGSYSPIRPTRNHAAPLPFFATTYGGARQPQDNTSLNNRTGTLGGGRLPSGAKVPDLSDPMTTERQNQAHTGL